jgi:catechol 2,3-dioxygenase-like lactoylglutathione lyase family enzyme
MAKKFSKMLGLQFVAGILLCWVALAQLSAAQASDTQARTLSGLAPHHVTISVENLDRVSEWYVTVLGFKPEPHAGNDPNFQVQHVTIPGYRIDLIQFKGSSRPAPANPIYLRQGWIHIAFSVPDLPAALKQLQALNTDVRADNKDAKGLPTRLVVHDPEGNEIELFSRE